MDIFNSSKYFNRSRVSAITPKICRSYDNFT